MFDFEKLIAYQKAKREHLQIQQDLSRYKDIPLSAKDQLYRASLSMVLNIAEGTGKTSKKDRQNFYTIARGSAYECASLLDILSEEGRIPQEKALETKNRLEEVSRMLSGLMKSLN